MFTKIAEIQKKLDPMSLFMWVFFWTLRKVNMNAYEKRTKRFFAGSRAACSMFTNKLFIVKLLDVEVWGWQIVWQPWSSWESSVNQLLWKTCARRRYFNLAYWFMCTGFWQFFPCPAFVLSISSISSILGGKCRISLSLPLDSR